MRMMMAQKETIERELAKLQVLLAPYTHTQCVSHTHTPETLNEREGFQNSCILSQDLLILEQGENIEFI